MENQDLEKNDVKRRIQSYRFKTRVVGSQVEPWLVVSWSMFSSEEFFRKQSMNKIHRGQVIILVKLKNGHERVEPMAC
jgi:hypothetical protein